MKNELFLKYSGTNFNGGNIMANTRVRIRMIIYKLTKS